MIATAIILSELKEAAKWGKLRNNRGEAVRGRVER
jgi:hypothetical protein